MYNPHITECASCLKPFEDGQTVIPHYEDYLCVPCAPVHIIELGNYHVWRDPEVLKKTRD